MPGSCCHPARDIADAQLLTLQQELKKQIMLHAHTAVHIALGLHWTCEAADTGKACTAVFPLHQHRATAVTKRTQYERGCVFAMGAALELLPYTSLPQLIKAVRAIPITNTLELRHELKDTFPAVATRWSLSGPQQQLL